MDNQVINYSQCWEDTNLLEKSLKINTNDTVLSITSGGDNTLFLLSLNPQKIVSIDINPVQNYLLELKLAAVKILNYQDYLEFLGVKKSQRRLEIFRKIQISISAEARLWWEKHYLLIRGGVINAGRFETFLNLIQRFILPFIHSKKTIQQFLNSEDLSQQRNFYDSVWNSLRWRLLFKIFSSKSILKAFARQKGIFEHANAQKVGNIYFQRFHKNFQNIPIKNNYFLHYCLSGCYRLDSLPPYLDFKNKDSLINNKIRVDIVTSNIFDYLKSMPSNYFSKFNLSDVFEMLSEKENDGLWREIVRTAKNGAKLVYWNNLIDRTYPEYLSENIFNDKETAKQLFKIDKTPFYGNFHINKIVK